MKREDYTAVAKSLHWLIAILIFVQFPLGWVMTGFSGIQKIQAFNFHKSLGLTVLGLMALRLVWRFSHPAPELPPSMPKRERAAAYLAHAALYVTIFLIAIAGWGMISASKFPSSFFEVALIPKLPWLSGLPASDQKSYEELFKTMHMLLGYALLALITIHLAGALRHAIILRDGIFSRMLPRFGQDARSLRTALLILGAGTFSVWGFGEARAAEWSVDPDKSEVTFEATGSGYDTKGSFKTYKTEIEFDPDAPDQASVRVTLDVRSASTGAPDVDQTLQSEDFFNPARYPTAEFVARGAKSDGDDGKYVLTGRLTLKGVTKPVTLPFSIAIESGTAAVKGEATINRLDFGVGPETVAGFAVDKDVKLTIDLTAVRLDN